MAKQAKKKLTIEEFLPLYLKAAEDGLTKEEFAEQVGLQPSTVYQRVYELRREVDPSIPLLATRGRVPMQERAAAILEEYRSAKTETPKAEPKPAAKPKQPEPMEEDSEDEDAESELDKIFGSN